MRAGSATSPSQIQAIGRWKSDTYERYIQRHPSSFHQLFSLYFIVIFIPAYLPSGDQEYNVKPRLGLT